MDNSIVESNTNYSAWNAFGVENQRELFFLDSMGNYVFDYNISPWTIDIMNIALDNNGNFIGNIADWEDDLVYNSILELKNWGNNCEGTNTCDFREELTHWGEGCADNSACNYDQISEYDNEACWYANDGCQCSDGENAALNNDGICNILSINSGPIQDEYKIHRIYPNPFNPITNISYELTISSVIKLIVYNLQGTQIATLVNNFQNSGVYSINWNASSYSSGVYLIRLESGEYTQTQKMVLIK